MSCPFSAGPHGPSISHLLFADDCILLGKATVHNATTFASIFQRYCQASGQKINLQKSSICFSPRITGNTKAAIIRILGITKQTDRLFYLGIPITGRRPRCSDYTDLERRVRDRLDGWQVSGLSMMARITLLRTVLTSLPLYLLSNSAVPLSCLRRIERCFRDFLWASSQDGHGVHLLAWDTVCLPIADGGLGIQSLIVRREALMARHATRFLLDPHSLWSSFMRARYGAWTPSTDFQSTRGHSFFWKEVCRHAPDILNNISWMIGDGSLVDAVQDAWIADIPLSCWPTFISHSVPSSMRVSDLITQDLSSWNLPTVARCFGDELARRILSIPIIPGHIADTRLWRRSCLPSAPVKDLMKIYRPQAQHIMDVAWIWRLPIHPRIQLFMWKLARDCLPTCSMLSSRGLSIQPTCPVCGREDETTDHAIFTCPRARQIWQSIGYHHHIGQDVTASPRATLLTDIRRGNQQLVATWAYTAYQIWISRNHLVFADDHVSPQMTARRAISLSVEYTHYRSAPDFDSPGHWGSSAASAANRHTVFISWEPPPPGFVKINFDGSVRGRLVGSAFIIRGFDGAMLAAGGLGLLDCSVPLAELYAAWAGISYATRILRAHCLLIEGDSITVIRWLRQDSGDQVAFNPLLHDIRATLQEAHRVHIRHVYREANSAADWIAGSVAYRSGIWIWKQGDPCPFVLKQILFSDSSGLTHMRSV